MAKPNLSDNEFALISHYFAKQHALQRKDVLLGIGDDCAVVTVPKARKLAMTIDTLVAGVHFPQETSAADIGHKALAVNLSDLAAAGAEPAWVTLALTLPHVDHSWLRDFCKHFFALAKQFNVGLIGGDTTRGPLTVTVQAHGFVPVKKIISRGDARPGDLIYVTNTVGDAGLALQMLQKKIDVAKKDRARILRKLNRPMPRVLEGLALRPFVSAMIDVSDGLAADLGHILVRSDVGAILNVESLPLSNEMKRSVSIDVARKLALMSGDDYELCFTVPRVQKKSLENAMWRRGMKITCIGEITRSKKLRLQLNDGKEFLLKEKGYLHF